MDWPRPGGNGTGERRTRAPAGLRVCPACRTFERRGHGVGSPPPRAQTAQDGVQASHGPRTPPPGEAFTSWPSRTPVRDRFPRGAGKGLVLTESMSTPGGQDEVPGAPTEPTRAAGLPAVPEFRSAPLSLSGDPTQVGWGIVGHLARRSSAKGADARPGQCGVGEQRGAGCTPPSSLSLPSVQTLPLTNETCFFRGSQKLGKKLSKPADC